MVIALSRKNKHSTNSEYFVDMNSYRKTAFFQVNENFAKKEFLLLNRKKVEINNGGDPNSALKNYLRGWE